MSQTSIAEKWVDEAAALTRPDRVVWADGSPAEYDRLVSQMLADGTLLPLNGTTHPGCYLHRSHPSDVTHRESHLHLHPPGTTRGRPTIGWRRARPRTRSRRSTTVLTIPGKMAAWRRASLFVVYGFALLSLMLHLYTTQLFVSGTNDPLLVDPQRFNSIYSVYAFAFLLLCGLSVFNLIEAKRLSTSFIAKKQINMLIGASLMTSLATILSIIGAIPGASIPVFWISSILVLAVGFFGIGVTRYSAVMGQRILRRDLAYSAVATGLVVLLYLGMFVWLINAYDLPEGIVVFGTG